MDLDEAERIGNAATAGDWQRCQEFAAYAHRHWPEIIAGLRDRDRLREENEQLKSKPCVHEMVKRFSENTTPNY